MTIVVEREDLHRDVAGQRIVLELAQDRPAQNVGQVNVERDRRRVVIRRKRQGVDAAVANDALEADFACCVEQDARVVADRPRR